MRRLQDLEKRKHGDPEFPIELFRVDDRSRDFIMRFHWHPECELVYVRKGKFPLMVDERLNLLSAGDVAFIPSMSLHGGTPNEGCEYDCIVFSQELLTKNVMYPAVIDFFSREGNTQVKYDAGKYPELCNVVSNLCTVMRRTRTETMRLRVSGLMLEAVALMSEVPTVLIQVSEENISMGRIRQAMKYIQGHYAEHITAGDIAKECGITAKHLCRLFSSFVGKPPLAYLNEYRIDVACRMLRDEGTPVSEIAALCGIEDQSYFSKLFRRQTGLTPSDYRKKFRKD